MDCEPVAVYVEKVQNEETNQQKGYSQMTDEVGDRKAHELKPSIHDSSAGKLFVGGIACETTKESFRKHFSQFGEVTNSELMMHKSSGWPRGFGFVTYADPEIADKVLEENHIIDGRVVEVKKTVPKEHVKGALNTKKIFVGGLPLSLTENELKEYFSSYGNVVEHQIMLDQTTGRGRGFGFVRFDKEEAVEKVLSNGHMHKLCGKQVEIKRAETKRTGADQHTSKSRVHCCGCGSTSYIYGGDGGSVDVFGGIYGGYGGYEGYNDYGRYGASPIGYLYPGYGYGFWFGGGMYDAAGYGGSIYGVPAYYGGGGGGGGGNGSNDWGNGGYGGGGVNGAYAYGNDGAANGRFHP